MITWIVENLNKESSYIELADAVKKAGHPLIEIDGDYTKQIFRDKLDHYVTVNGDAVYNRFPVIFNGSIEMAKIVSKELHYGGFPIIYSDFPKYKCSAYYSHFSKFLLNDKYILMSLLELKRQRYFVYGALGKEGLIFLRPDSGEKTFQAQLVDILDLDRFVANNKKYEHDLVLISTPKKIVWEGRFICSEKEIIAQSTYKYQDQITKIPSVPPNSLAKCQEILDNVEYRPDKVFCLDLCQDGDNEFSLLELTSFSSAGLYASNKDLIVKRVSEITLENYGIS